MKICCNCSIEMVCKKNGVGVDFGHGHVYVGDKYECPLCQCQVIVTNQTAIFDPEYNLKDEYFKMENT